MLCISLMYFFCPGWRWHRGDTWLMNKEGFLMATQKATAAFCHLLCFGY